jgi:hypothetical protein
MNEVKKCFGKGLGWICALNRWSVQKRVQTSFCPITPSIKIIDMRTVQAGRCLNSEQIDIFFKSVGSQEGGLGGGVILGRRPKIYTRLSGNFLLKAPACSVQKGRPQAGCVRLCVCVPFVIMAFSCVGWPKPFLYTAYPDIVARRKFCYIIGHIDTGLTKTTRHILVAVMLIRSYIMFLCGAGRPYSFILLSLWPPCMHMLGTWLLICQICQPHCSCYVKY